VARAAIAALLAAQTVRTLAADSAREHWLAYAALIAVYLGLYALAAWRPPRPASLVHAYLTLQAVLVLAMLDVDPRLDSVTAFFVPLAFQAALLLAGRPLWTWVAILTVLTGGSLAFYLGPFQGVALAMSPAVFLLGLPALMVAHHETELARERSQALLAELQATHRQLEAYAGQVEELATLRERGRLARQLHDTVSQLVFGITLSSRSTQLLLERDPARVREQLERLRETSGNALAQLRSLITQMRL
jgi:signal transduction histidine kinase